MKNIGGSYGGALTAGLFLQEFVDGVPWVHLDIAGPAFLGSDDGYLPKGGTGFGVRTLIELADTFEAPPPLAVGRPSGGTAQGGSAQDSRAQGGDAEVHHPEGCRRSTRTRASVRFRSGALVAALALVAPALVFVASPAAARVPAEDDVVTVHVRDNVFRPSNLAVETGDGRALGQRRPEPPQRQARLAAAPSAARTCSPGQSYAHTLRRRRGLRLLLHAPRHAGQGPARQPRRRRRRRRLDVTPVGASDAPAPTIAASGRTIRVPADAKTIQAGVDRARPGDLVLVSPGVYREKVTIVDRRHRAARGRTATAPSSTASSSARTA